MYLHLIIIIIGGKQKARIFLFIMLAVYLLFIWKANQQFMHNNNPIDPF